MSDRETPGQDDQFDGWRVLDLGNVGEVEMREFAKGVTCGVVVGAGRILGCGEVPEVIGLALKANFSAPAFGFDFRGSHSADATESTLVPSCGAISRVQRPGTESEIRSAVVQPISASMVNFLARLSMQDEPMHVDLACFALLLPATHRIEGIPMPVRTPRVPQDTLSILGVDDSDLALCQGDLNNGRLVMHRECPFLVPPAGTVPTVAGHFRSLNYTAETGLEAA